MPMVQQWLVDRAYGSWHDLTCDLLHEGRGKDERQFLSGYVSVDRLGRERGTNSGAASRAA
jgi:hypothetical protein